MTVHPGDISRSCQMCRGFEFEVYPISPTYLLLQMLTAELRESRMTPVRVRVRDDAEQDVIVMLDVPSVPHLPRGREECEDVEVLEQ